jgi:uncharacterized protein
VKNPPSRTCLGCRRARAKAALVRLARLPNGTVVVDSGPRATGRGAYVCPDPECVARGLTRGRLGHAFRRPSEAGANLAAEALAAGPCETKASLAEASAAEAVLYEVGARAIGNVDTITVRT